MRLDGIRDALSDEDLEKFVQSYPTVSVERQLEVHLGKPPERYGWARVQWDGPTLAQHLKRHFGVSVRVRQAERWLHRMGYRMKRAGYVYVQAKAADAKRFQRHIKKASEPETG